MDALSISGASMQELSEALTYAELVLNKGESVDIGLITSSLLTEEDVTAWHLEMVEKGFHVTRPVSGYIGGKAVTGFTATKGSPALMALIPLIPAVLTAGLIAFGVVKIETITKSILPILLVAGGITIVGLALIRKPAEAAATYYLQSKGVK